MSLTPQEELKLKITAFFFNSKADALRSEMYRSLCLLALANSQRPISIDEIVSSILLYLGTSNPISKGLKVIVTDELAVLSEKGEINILENALYEIKADDEMNTPTIGGEKILLEKISGEIHQIAKDLNPTLSKVQFEKLEQFFLEVSNLVASHQVPFLTRGEAIHVNSMDDQQLVSAVSECRNKYDIDKYIDGDKFIRRTFINPTEELSRYLYSLYQVSVAIHLLTWDPSLQYIEKNVLANLKIYLDTNIVFILMQKTSVSHQFVWNLIQASAELGVRFIVHSTTIKEYESVIGWNDEQFESYQKTLREIMKICKRDGENPASYIEGSIYTDYFLKNLDRIDQGTWQEYLSTISLPALQKALTALGVHIETANAFVPQIEYDDIKAALLKASKEQSERKKRQIKGDTGHDARIYYKVKTTRRKRSEGELSLGFDTYLLTFDGSLIFFLKNYDIPWTETYFLFPDQWYELSFPFFRPKFANVREFTSAVTSLVFSPAFPSISSLMPLELCKYIFDMGGNDLPMGSIQSVIHEGIEKKIIDNVDPANRDRKRKEEHDVDIKRMIAREKMKHEKIVAHIYEDARQKQDDAIKLEKTIHELSTEKANLSKEIEDQLVELNKTQRLAKLTSAQQAQTEKSNFERNEIVNKLNLQTEKLNDEITRKEKEIQKKDSRIAELEKNIGGMQVKLDEILKRQIEQENKQEEERKKGLEENKKRQVELTERRDRTRKMVVSILMILGFLISLSVLIVSGFSLLWILAVALLMAIGLVSYFRVGLWAFIPYGFGLIAVTGLIMDKYNLNVALWVIPMAWEIAIFVLEKGLKKDT